MKNLEQLKETYKKLGEEIKELENPKINFSGWIGRSGNILCIKGEKNLFSYRGGEILYTNRSMGNNEEEIHYEYTTLDKLKEGDIFICECDLDNIEKKHFNVFMGKNNTGYYINQHLETSEGIEHLENYYSYGNIKVIKFLRN